MKTVRVSAAVLALTLSLTFAACGSGSSTSTQESTSAQNPAPSSRPGGSSREAEGGSKGAGTGSEAAEGSKQNAESPPPEPHFTPRPHHDSAGGSKQFVQKSGDNSVQEYGSERSGSEFSEAAEALHIYLDARAAGAWRAACEVLAGKLVHQLIDQFEAAGEDGGSCAATLASFSSGLPPGALREAAIANVAAFRSGGDNGFVIFKGARGETFFIPMHREEGRWKVGAIGASPLP